MWVFSVFLFTCNITFILCINMNNLICIGRIRGRWKWDLERHDSTLLHFYLIVGKQENPPFCVCIYISHLIYFVFIHLSGRARKNGGYSRKMRRRQSGSCRNLLRSDIYTKSFLFFSDISMLVMVMRAVLGVLLRRCCCFFPWKVILVCEVYFWKAVVTLEWNLWEEGHSFFNLFIEKKKNLNNFESV